MADSAEGNTQETVNETENTEVETTAGGDATFSQADLDKVVENRLARERKKYADYDELKSKASQFDEVVNASKSELEQAQERASKAEADSQARIDAANLRLFEAAVLTEATKQKAIKPEHMFKLVDTDNVTIDDDGVVTGVDEAVANFLSTNPEYVGTGRPAPDVDQGARDSGAASQLSREDLQSMSPEAIVEANRQGRLERVKGSN